MGDEKLFLYIYYLVLFNPEMATSEASAIWAQSTHCGASGRDYIYVLQCHKRHLGSIREFSFNGH
jgi:hypothetical protein